MSVTNTLTLQEKVVLLRTELKKYLVERDEDIDVVLMGLLSGCNVFLYGEPGIAKSYLIDICVKLISGLAPGDYFNLLMMKSTTREDVFGPLSLTALDEDRYYFMPEGYFPECKIGFLDEFWKANAAIQNSMLWAANEKKYRNDGKVERLPLHTLFIASNEIPDDDALHAIYDRFPLRKIVNRISEPGSFIEMMKSEEKPGAPVISWDDIVAAGAEIEKVQIKDIVYDKLVDLKTKLREKEVYPSDRRFKQAKKIIKAAAWMDGDEVADVEHIQLLRFVLWSDPKEFDEVEKICLTFSNPADVKIRKIQTDLRKLNSELDKIIADPGDQEQRMRAGNGVYEKIKMAKTELIAIAEELKGSKKRSTKLDEAADQVTNITKRMLTKIFETTEEQIQEGLQEFSAPLGAKDEEEPLDDTE